MCVLLLLTFLHLHTHTKRARLHHQQQQQQQQQQKRDTRTIYRGEEVYSNLKNSELVRASYYVCVCVYVCVLPHTPPPPPHVLHTLLYRETSIYIIYIL